MDKILIRLLVLIYSVFSMVHSCHATPNLANGKAYIVSPQQNYTQSVSAPASDTTSLTDGKYTVGYFWSQKTTVGWQRAKTVEIIIDLEKEYNIGSIAFNTARGEGAGVYYPAHIAAFVGTDHEHLLYVGDIAINSENQPGSYQIKRFELNGIGIRGRYVFLEVVPKGLYLFCDEIEVIEGSSGSGQKGTLSVDQSRTFTDQIRRIGIEKELQNGQIDNLNKTIVDVPEEEHIRKIKRQIASLQTTNDVKAVEADMLALRCAVLRARFPGNELMIQTINPWAQITPNIFPVEVAPLALSFMLPKGGYDSQALIVTNLSEKSRGISVSLDKSPAGVELVLYQVPFIKTAAMEYVADPLVPVEKRFMLRPGESRLVFVIVHGTQSGTWSHTLRIKREDRVKSIPITTYVANTELPKNLRLNSVNWAELNFKLIRDRKQIAVNDLLSHHTNVIDVPPAYLPIGELVQDFGPLEEYLRISNGITKVLLFANFRPVTRSSVNGKYAFMGNEWKVWFEKWFEELTKVAAKAGIPKENLYFYPYDEMDGKHVEDFIAFATWVRKEISDIRLYATINNKSALQALPYLDVAQVVNREDLLGDIRTTGPEIWLYKANGPAKSLSPYSYYRMMSWKAFLNGYTGVGFWAYADAGSGDNPGTAWDDFDGKNPDYAVIYEGEGNTIISSRRWEAWRMGIEDYELLTMYAKAKGDGAAKALAKYVLDNTNDLSRADEVRRKILVELSR
ncbi:MAG: hypothetical protein JETT_2501 [Candidatus Jettenia ecosi]|uniref:Glycoside hydrolase 123 C-terminal domain-containing protein n=1 Tax=Candidatus Jettenia ecosi TaxID=2494326 RepID=A0A533Q945_9BACT|nr:MAG: hypothetical protein JETT_2501 [Candidatus Jettenia ecosi]